LPAEVVVGHRAVALGGTSRRLPARSAGLLSGQDTLTVATLEQKVAMQIAGLGVGWLPESFARTHLACGRLVARQSAEPRPPAMLHYGWRKSDVGNALKWWLQRLDLPRVRERLLDGPQTALLPETDAPPDPPAEREAVPRPARSKPPTRATTSRTARSPRRPSR
jgi:hypothetical protein